MAGCTRSDPARAFRDAEASYQRDDYDRSLEITSRHLEGPDVWRWRFTVLKAEVLAAQGQHKLVINLLSAGPPSSVPPELAARWKMTLGMALAQNRDLTRASALLTEARTISTGVGGELPGEIALRSGALERLRGDFAGAERDLRQALETAKSAGSRFLEFRALSNLALILMRNSHYGEAADSLQRALELARSFDAQVSAARILSNLGLSYLMLGDLESAERALVEANSFFAQRPDVNRSRLLCLQHLGRLHYTRGDYAEAERYWSDSLALARQIDDRQLVSQCLNNLALVAIETGQLERAAGYNNEAIELKRALKDRSAELHSIHTGALIVRAQNKSAEAETGFRQVLGAKEAEAPLRWLAHADLADLYAGEGRTEDAQRHFRQAIRAVSDIRTALVRDEHKLSFHAAATRFYDAYIRFLMRQGKEAEALEVADWSRSRSLTEKLGLPLDRVPASRFRESAAHLNASILFYWLGAKESVLWVITRDGISAHRLPPRAEIARVVHDFRRAIAGPSDPLNAPAAARLSHIVLAPAASGIGELKRIVIVPDGELHGVNFETLIADKPSPHYWVEDVEIVTAPSLALLGQSVKRSVKENVLLIGDALSAGPEFPALPYARTEIETLNRMFKDRSPAVYTRAAATPAAYSKASSENASLVHFAAHGVSSFESPLDSAIILSHGPLGYKLYAREILKTPMHARLVTISACYGAGTRSYTGEGLVGLAWAFLAAGSENVVASLWQAGDASTARLMESFYGSLIKGANAPAALRAAKLEHLRSSTLHRFPRYWGSFVLYTRGG